MTDRQAAEVVLHVADDPAQVARAVSAAEALRQARAGTRVRIVVNGPALDALLAAAEPLQLGSDVSVEACEIGMRRRDIDPDGLQPGVSSVGSAVIALFDAQQAGASYIRIG